MPVHLAFHGAAFHEYLILNSRFTAKVVRATCLGGFTRNRSSRSELCVMLAGICIPCPRVIYTFGISVYSDLTGGVGAEPTYSGTSWTALALEVGKSPTEVTRG